MSRTRLEVRTREYEAAALAMRGYTAVAIGKKLRISAMRARQLVAKVGGEDFQAALMTERYAHRGMSFLEQIQARRITTPCPCCRRYVTD